MWRCPKCRVINTSDVCTLCGYEKGAPISESRQQEATLNVKKESIAKGMSDETPVSERKENKVTSDFGMNFVAKDVPVAPNYETSPDVESVPEIVGVKKTLVLPNVSEGVSDETDEVAQKTNEISDDNPVSVAESMSQVVGVEKDSVSQRVDDVAEPEMSSVAQNMPEAPKYDNSFVAEKTNAFAEEKTIGQGNVKKWWIMCLLCFIVTGCIAVIMLLGMKTGISEIKDIFVNSEKSSTAITVCLGLLGIETCAVAVFSAVKAVFSRKHR